jgi:hypothetical protein
VQDQNKTLAVLDDVVIQLERLLRDSSAIGLDRARVSLILANCRQVQAALRPSQAAPLSDAGITGPQTGERSDAVDGPGARPAD